MNQGSRSKEHYYKYCGNTNFWQSFFNDTVSFCLAFQLLRWADWNACNVASRLHAELPRIVWKNYYNTQKLKALFDCIFWSFVTTVHYCLRVLSACLAEIHCSLDICFWKPMMTTLCSQTKGSMLKSFSIYWIFIEYFALWLHTEICQCKTCITEECCERWDQE